MKLTETPLEWLKHAVKIQWPNCWAQEKKLQEIQVDVTKMDLDWRKKYSTWIGLEHKEVGSRSHASRRCYWSRTAMLLYQKICVFQGIDIWKAQKIQISMLTKRRILEWLEKTMKKLPNDDLTRRPKLNLKEWTREE